jgi:hypothetical protein
MNALDLLNHLLNFAAPAFFVALLLVLVTRLFKKNRPGSIGLWAQIAIVFIAGLVVLGGGLAYFGRDGMMATYSALVLVCGTTQWAMLRG